MQDVLDLDHHPLDRLDSLEGQRLIAESQQALAENGMFDLVGLLRPAALARCIAELKPLIDGESFTHKRAHNVYFRKTIEGLAPDHPALRLMETVNHTLCGDQMRRSLITRIYEWPPLRRFLAAAMGKPELFVMDDPLARVNVMAYREGEALNWHFDRSEFTTTLLLQAPEAGGEFEYRSDLRSDTDPNYEGVARLLEGHDKQKRTLKLEPGTLNVFKGRNTAHRVTPAEGARERIIAVFSYYDRPGVTFSAEERMGFYGRAA